MYRPIPAKILTVDYVGVHNEACVKFQARAEMELIKLEQRVLRGNLKQGVSTTMLEDGVKVVCTVTYNLKEAIVYINPVGAERMVYDPCYCCSPCLAAGMITDIYAEDIDGTFQYETDDDFYADIQLCQAPDMTLPVKVTLIEEKSAGGVKSKTERILANRTNGAIPQILVPFSDKHYHNVGDSVMILIMPLYNFADYPGVYSPCTNQRKLTNEAITEPYPVISQDYINSSGVSCQIGIDAQMWDDSIEPYTGDDKYLFFRILPIKIDSCLS